MKSILFFLCTCLFVLTFFPSQAQKSNQLTQMVKDRQGNGYPVVNLPNGKKMLGKNLHYKTQKSSCPKNIAGGCKKYGGYFKYSAAISNNDVCRVALGTGWRLPDLHFVRELITFSKRNSSIIKLLNKEGDMAAGYMIGDVIYNENNNSFTYKSTQMVRAAGLSGNFWVKGSHFSNNGPYFSMGPNNPNIYLEDQGNSYLADHEFVLLPVRCVKY